MPCLLCTSGNPENVGMQKKISYPKWNRFCDEKIPLLLSLVTERFVQMWQ